MYSESETVSMLLMLSDTKKNPIKKNPNNVCRSKLQKECKIYSNLFSARPQTPIRQIRFDRLEKL